MDCPPSYVSSSGRDSCLPLDCIVSAMNWHCQWGWGPAVKDLDESARERAIGGWPRSSGLGQKRFRNRHESHHAFAAIATGALASLLKWIPGSGGRPD